MEIWRPLLLWIFPRLGGPVDEHFRTLEGFLPVSVEVADTGTAGAVVSVAHGLGRVPKGMLILNQEVGVGAGPVSWYREVGDAAWTVRAAEVRFDVSNARVMLWFF